MSCCIKYHDIAVKYDEKCNFLILLVVLCYLLVVLYYLKYFIFIKTIYCILIDFFFLDQTRAQAEYSNE